MLEDILSDVLGDPPAIPTGKPAYLAMGRLDATDTGRMALDVISVDAQP